MSTLVTGPLVTNFQQQASLQWASNMYTQRRQYRSSPDIEEYEDAY